MPLKSLSVVNLEVVLVNFLRLEGPSDWSENLDHYLYGKDV
jgi:hypothetical protein